MDVLMLEVQSRCLSLVECYYSHPVMVIVVLYHNNNGLSICIKKLNYFSSQHLF